MKKLTILASLCLALSEGVSAGVMTIYGDRADTQVFSAGIFNGDPGQNVGQSGFNGGFDYSMVFVFQLPVLGPGQSITAADFNVYVISAGSNFNTDLYGLSYRIQPTVLASDWYTGTGDANNTLLQAGFIPPSFSFSGRTETSDTGDAALLNFINAQYAAGAVGGEYIFLRLSTNASRFSNLNVNFYYASDVAYFLAAASTPDLGFWQDRHAPRLRLTVADTATPEPSTAAFAVVGLTAAALLARRR
ncbi:MAG: hypothetical protein JST93_21365 [Acidobacteria bacterium]|nr:hypothetical protein [Acidobacteriota bacterium]